MLMPALPKLSDIFLAGFRLKNGRVNTSGCGWKVPTGQITADNFNYQTLFQPPQTV